MRGEQQFNKNGFIYTCRAEKVLCLNNSQISIENKRGIFSHFFLSFTSSGINTFSGGLAIKISHTDALFFQQKTRAYLQANPQVARDFGMKEKKKLKKLVILL